MDRDRRRILGYGAAAGLTLTVAGAQPAGAAPRRRVRGPRSPGLEAFDETIERYMAARGIRSGSLAVVRDGRLMLTRGYARGPRGPEPVRHTSLFRVASLSKPITAAAIMKLVDDGRLDLSARVTDLVPMEPPPGSDRDARLDDITVLHLLQHHGGWDRLASGSFDPMFADRFIADTLGRRLPVRRPQIISFMSGRPLDFDPGARYAYSNFGYLVLGEVLRRVTGRPYRRAVEELVLAPLGIDGMRLARSTRRRRAGNEVVYRSRLRGPSVLNASGATVRAPYGTFRIENMDAHGGWLASAVDLVRFAGAFDDAPRTRVLSADAIETVFAQPSTGAEPSGSWYGCGWQVRPAGDGRNTWHTGSLPGTTTLLVRRWDGLSWAALFNQRDDRRDPAGTTYFDIDGELHDAADSVTSWPTRDLFGHPSLR